MNLAARYLKTEKYRLVSFIAENELSHYIDSHLGTFTSFLLIDGLIAPSEVINYLNNKYRYLNMSVADYLGILGIPRSRVRYGFDNVDQFNAAVSRLFQFIEKSREEYTPKAISHIVSKKKRTMPKTLHDGKDRRW